MFQPGRSGQSPGLQPTPVPEVVSHLQAGEGLEELLVSRVGERGPTELVTEGAFEELEEAMNRGEIATIAQAHRFLL